MSSYNLSQTELRHMRWSGKWAKRFTWRQSTSKNDAAAVYFKQRANREAWLNGKKLGPGLHTSKVNISHGRHTCGVLVSLGMVWRVTTSLIWRKLIRGYLLIEYRGNNYQPHCCSSTKYQKLTWSMTCQQPTAFFTVQNGFQEVFPSMSRLLKCHTFRALL